MKNYQNGKIYKIEATNGDENDDVYIGSTTEIYLSKRMVAHRCGYKIWKKNGTKFLTSYNVFEKHGVENCQITLLESVFCNSKDELHAREAFYIKASKNVNKNMPNRTKKDYFQQNKESIQAYKKQWHIDNTDKEKQKKYREDNAETIKKKSKRKNNLFLWYNML